MGFLSKCKTDLNLQRTNQIGIIGVLTLGLLNLVISCAESTVDLDQMVSDKVIKTRMLQVNMIKHLEKCCT